MMRLIFMPLYLKAQVTLYLSLMPCAKRLMRLRVDKSAALA